MPDRLYFVGYRTASLSKAKDSWKKPTKWAVAPMTALFVAWWLREGISGGFDPLVPIPWSEKPELGPMQVIARAVARYGSAFIGVEAVMRAIVKHGGQHLREMSRQERLKAVQSMYSAGPHISLVRGKRVLLVDDVHTTGASTCRAAKILIEHGARSVSAFAIAKNWPISRCVCDPIAVLARLLARALWGPER